MSKYRKEIEALDAARRGLGRVAERGSKMEAANIWTAWQHADEGGEEMSRVGEADSIDGAVALLRGVAGQVQAGDDGEVINVDERGGYALPDRAENRKRREREKLGGSHKRRRRAKSEAGSAKFEQLQFLATNYLNNADSRADVADGLNRLDWSEVHIALDEAGESHLWGPLRAMVLEASPDADI